MKTAAAFVLLASGAAAAEMSNSSNCSSTFYKLFLECGNDENMCIGMCQNFTAQLAPVCTEDDWVEMDDGKRRVLDAVREADAFCSPCFQRFRDITERQPQCLAALCLGSPPPECTDVMQAARHTCAGTELVWDFEDGKPMKVYDYLMQMPWCSQMNHMGPHGGDGDLVISGFHCMDGANEHVNGLYRHMGSTADGRPYYSRTDMMGSPELWLHYDEACAPGFPPAWLITDHRPDLRRLTDLNGPAPGCPFLASISPPQYMDSMSPPMGGHMWDSARCGGRESMHRGITVERVAPPARCVNLPWEKAMRMGVLPCPAGMHADMHADMHAGEY
eukprot:CAMPEP_0176248390 /NCGR_PEP_ID=MMETSP0121_2-20121125/33442_1 /TAXON_ID=160619 /ORGANISM="Kryptoperidinium foliaceum, Strain CCMP 1326" /LENGTH=331 /DNA_ID=CAMNT_0017588067 /DNA_START=67 /DNA_END=1062 /DNA_ORIENTATION=+